MIRRVEIKPNIAERALNVVSPKAAVGLFHNRLRKLQDEAINEAGVTMATGYGNHGASRTKNSLIGWLTGGGSPEDDSDLHGRVLRIRARDLDAGGGLARAATRTMKTNVIGSGLIPKPKIDFEALGISEEAAMEWQKLAKREFALWAESTACDAERRSNFYQLQQLAYLTMMLSGDTFALMPTFDIAGFPYKTHVRLLEADRICTPESSGDSTSKDTDSGGKIIDGVEFDANGMVVAYHITNRHPLASSDSRTIEYVAVQAYGSKTGFPNVLHVMTMERPGQARGIPFVAPMIEQLKQLSRYSDAELTANIIASMMTLFLTQEAGSGDNPNMGIEDAVSEAEKVTTDDTRIELAPGAIYKLEPGTKPEMVGTSRANNSYGDYVTNLITQIGASMEIPGEVLMKKFNSNYSASRGALLEFWHMIPVARKNFVSKFNNPIYEAVIAEAVATGRLEAPGFFDDAMIRKAWCGVDWIGTNMGIIDPKKEVEAAIKRIATNISTEEREAAEFNGSDWAENIVQRRKEMKAAYDMAVEFTPPAQVSAPIDGGAGDRKKKSDADSNDDDAEDADNE